MRRPARLAVIAATAALVLSLPTAAVADPDDGPGGGHGHSGQDHHGGAELPPFSGPSSLNFTLVGNSDKDGTTNSDLAFWKNYAFAGNYNGFRILDVEDPSQPKVLSDYFCRGPQNDVSVYKVKGKLLLFQSVDSAQDKESCDGTVAGSSKDNPVLPSGSRKFGFEGLRMYDVTNPAEPVYLDAIPTACGSHTHTLVPDKKNQRLVIYVSSYPLGSGITDPAEVPAAGDLACVKPHQAISVVEVPFSDPTSWTAKKKMLSSDTADAPGRGFKACHDIQVFMPKNVAVGSCGGDVQLWDISDPANPTTGDGEPHTHITSPDPSGIEPAGDNFEFMHSAVVTWDGKYLAAMDETGGGGTAECDGGPEQDGKGQSEDGFYYIYKMVKPGSPAPELESRFMIPRPQSTEICVSHNANMLPIKGRYLMSAAYYMGGDSLVEFTDVNNPQEIAYADLNDGTGAADSWSTYWYNGHVYANSGLNRRGATANRGLDIFQVQDTDGSVIKTRKFHHMNPQTQETFQATGG